MPVGGGGRAAGPTRVGAHDPSGCAVGCPGVLPRSSVRAHDAARSLMSGCGPLLPSGHPLPGCIPFILSTEL